MSYARYVRQKEAAAAAERREEEDEAEEEQEEEQQEVEEEAEEQEVVEEAEGLRLHLSQRNATGYNRGYKVPSARHDGSAPSFLDYLKAQAASTH